MLHCLESHARDPKVEIPGPRGKPLGLLTSKVLVLLTCLGFHCFKQFFIKFICFRNSPMFGGSVCTFKRSFCVKLFLRQPQAEMEGRRATAL